MNRNFLLTSKLARKLYNECARSLPIIDYHNHLSVADLSNDISFENIARLWVISDPYKHRAMRILGVSEKYITGDASDFEKFEVWYNSLPRLVGNALFDWSQMEMSTVFDFDLLPFTDAKSVWNTLNAKLSSMKLSDILAKFNIEYSAPCASVIDDLAVFDKARFLCPSLRGDDMLLPSSSLINKLSALVSREICSLSEYLSALKERFGAFYEVGCRFADHALDNGFDFLEDDGKNDARFTALISDGELSDEDKTRLSSYILENVEKLYAEFGFTVQLHIGAQRYTSTRLRTLAGPAGGYAAIGNSVNVKALIRLFDTVEKSEFGLPKTMLFTLNPADNAVMATLSGSYSKDGAEALVTQGPAWWWCDHYEGMTAMLNNFCTHSVLSTFVGMTTDSRSPLSFVRHDYFRRVLCEWIADMVSKDRLPNDIKLLSDTVFKICYGNAKNVLGGF